MYLSKDEFVKVIEKCKNDYINDVLLNADDSDEIFMRIDLAKLSSVMSFYNSIIEALNVKEKEEK